MACGLLLCHKPLWQTDGGADCDELREIYPDPSKVQVLPTTTLRELRRTNAPSALVEVAYHDNPEDAAWIRGNIDEIGKALSNAVAAYFGLR